MLALHAAARRFAYHWLIAALAALTAWPLILLARAQIPQTIALATWQPVEYFPFSPALFVDARSWLLAISLATVNLAALMTDVDRAPAADWTAWAAGLFVTGLGIAAVLSGNPLTMLLAWAALDLAELALLLWSELDPAGRERILVAFAARALGSLILFWAVLAGQTSGSDLGFALSSSRISLLFILAASLRLGVLPFNLPFALETPRRRNLGTVLRMAVAASGLTLLDRAAGGVSPGWAGLILPTAWITAGLAAVSWAAASDELDGRQFWILAISALAVAAAAAGDPGAVTAWSLGLIFAGSAIFSAARRGRLGRLLLLAAAAGFCALPFTPAESLARFYLSLGPVWGAGFLLVHWVLLAGYVRFTLTGQPADPAAERWTQVITLWGTGLLAVGYWALPWLAPPGSAAGAGQPGGAQPLLLLPGAALLALLAVLLAWRLRRPPLPGPFLARIRALVSMGWLQGALWSAYNLLGKGLSFISLALEGEGGVLWAVLLLILLLVYIVFGGITG
jgi:hypothetical protein